MRPGNGKRKPSSPAAASAAEAAVLGNDDLLREILVHLDHPTCLVHAALVCRRWLRHASDPAFLRRFRGLHPPRLLGLCVNGRFVPLPHPRELDAVFRRACFEELKGSVLDCRNGRALMLLSKMGQATENKYCYGLCSPLHQTPEFRIDLPSMKYCMFSHFLPEDGGNGAWYNAVQLVGSCISTKIFIRRFLMYAGTRSVVRISTTNTIELPSLPSRMICRAHRNLHVNKCYILGDVGCILELDLASIRLSAINLPDGVQESMENTELSRADGSGFYLIHLKGFQIHVWHHDTDGDNVGEWQLVDTICARQAIGHLAKPNWGSILESGGPDVGVYRAGDNAEFFLKVGLEVFYMQIKTRKVEKVFEMAFSGGDPFSVIQPFTMVWPPSFPTLSDEQVDRGQDE